MVGSVKRRANSFWTSAYTGCSQGTGERYAKDVKTPKAGAPLVIFKPEMTWSENIKPTGPVPAYLSPASSTAAFSPAISVLSTVAISQFLDCTMFLLTSRILISLEHFYHLSGLHTSFQNHFRKPYLAPSAQCPLPHYTALIQVLIVTVWKLQFIIQTTSSYILRYSPNTWYVP